jgi:hypothetical protein
VWEGHSLLTKRALNACRAGHVCHRSLRDKAANGWYITTDIPVGCVSMVAYTALLNTDPPTPACESKHSSGNPMSASQTQRMYDVSKTIEEAFTAAHRCAVGVQQSAKHRKSVETGQGRAPLTITSRQSKPALVPIIDRLKHEWIARRNTQLAVAEDASRKRRTHSSSSKQ